MERDSSEWSKMRTAQLSLLVQKDVAAAWTLFDTLKENSAAIEYQFTVMMGEKYFGNRVTHIFPLKINIKGKIPY